jgi:organic radical activating enzyme
MKISEIFTSIQGEGQYQGTTALFIRTSGCTRKCVFCDTQYHAKGEDVLNEDIIEKINTLKPDTVIFTGGEPLLFLSDILYIIISSKYGTKFHLETNGDLIKTIDDYKIIMDAFNYVAVSPKCIEVARRIDILKSEVKINSSTTDIKVVTNLRSVGLELLPYATTLMPLTVYNKKKDAETRIAVWNYCIEHKLHFSARLHVLVFGKKRGI